MEYILNFKEIKPVNSKGNQPWIFIGRSVAEVEAPILWPLDAKSYLIGKPLMLGKIEGESRRGQQGIRWLDSITNSLDMNLSKLQEIVQDRGAWCVIVHGITRVKHHLVTEQQRNWIVILFTCMNTIQKKIKLSILKKLSILLKVSCLFV